MNKRIYFKNLVMSGAVLAVGFSASAFAVDEAAVTAEVTKILAGIGILGLAGLTVYLAVQAWKKGRQAFS